MQVAYVLGVDGIEDGRSVAPVDIDGDGDLDLAVLSLQGLRLYENTLERRGRFARVRLAGTAHPPVGAIVEVHTSLGVSRDHVKVTDGFQTQVPLDLHFGLGRAEQVDALVIRWPDGTVERHDSLPVDRLLTATLGGEVVVSALPHWPAGSLPGEAARPSPAVSAVELDGERGALAVPARASVVNFWAPWCEPCAKELPALSRLHKRYRDSVDFVGVSVEVADLESVRRAVRRHRLGYSQRLADDGVIKAFFAGAEVPLPSTFVFDAGGRLRRVFRGAVTAADLGPLLDSFAEEDLFEADLRMLAWRAARLNQYATAAEAYGRLVARRPDDPALLHSLGLCQAQMGRVDEALATLARSASKGEGYIPALLDTGMLHMRARRHGEAADAFAAYVDGGGKDPRGALYLAVSAADAGQLDRAEVAILQAVAAAPGEVEPLLIKARLHRARGQVAEARAAYARVLQLAPQNAVARTEMSQLPSK